MKRPPPVIPVLRTWRRDSSQNLMGLDEAVANLHAARAGNDRFEQLNRLALRQQLLEGVEVGTPLAVFRLAESAI